MAAGARIRPPSPRPAHGEFAVPPSRPAAPYDPAVVPGWIRGLVYAAAGSAMEAGFTSARLTREARRPILVGPATRWMPVIYALALPLFEPAHDRLRGDALPVRAAAYAVGIMAVEGATGWALRRTTGRCPWDYRGRTEWSIDGLVRLDYAPLWALAGLGAERLHDALTGCASRSKGRNALCMR